MPNKIYSNALNKRAAERKVTLTKTVTPQTRAIPGREKEMSKNNAGGVTFTLDKWGYARRFLILGSESSTYYTSAQKLTKENAKNLIACAQEDGERLVNLIVEVSEGGFAPKNDPALFALAIAMTYSDEYGKMCAAEAFPMVARIGTHVLHLADFIHGMRSWGRPVRRGFSNIYNGWNDYNTAMQLVKYANRDGWTHKDVLRLAHVKPANDVKASLFARALEKEDVKAIKEKNVKAFLSAVDQIKRATTAKEAAKLITDYKLPREVVPTELLNDPLVWDALLPHMGMEAMVRNLATMTRVGLIKPLSNAQKTIREKMMDDEAIKASRIHPIKILAALLTYKTGKSVKGTGVWTPDQSILAGLDEMFYRTFPNITPTNKRILFAKDVSGSMTGGVLAGVPGLSPRVASAALVAFMMRTEPIHHVIGFTSSGRGWTTRGNGVNDISGATPLQINTSMNLSQIMQYVNGLSFGGTDVSLPMEYARVNKIPVDAFVITTDNETYAGYRQPSQALEAYRQSMGIDAKVIVMGMTATKFTVADPKDAGMLDVVGFDTSVPTLMNDFISGRV